MPKVLAPGESFSDVLKEAGAFFAKEGAVWDGLARVTQRLAANGIDYALIGGVAMAVHGYMRFTVDVDLLVSKDGLTAARHVLIGNGYTEVRRDRLRDEVTGTPIDFVIGNDPAAVSAEMDGIRVVRLEKMIEFKLVAGLAKLPLLHDLADVQRLIEGLDLPLDLADKLDPSVRDTYIQYWHYNQTATGPDRE